MTQDIGTKALKPNPELQPLRVLIGEWQTTGSHPYFPNAVLHGRVSYEWIHSGAFLLMHSEVDHPKFPDGIALFGSDNEEGTIYMLYFDERGISRKYDVTVAKNHVTLERLDPHFSQRMMMTIEGDN